MNFKNKYIKTFSDVIKLAFKHNKILYWILFASFFSTFIEMLSMSLLSSLSGKKYIIFNTFLTSKGKEFVFFIIVVLFLIRFISLYFIETNIFYSSRMFHRFLATKVFKNILNQSINKTQSKPIGEFINMVGDESSKSSEILNSFLRSVSLFFIGFLYLVLIIYIDKIFIFFLLIFFLLNFFVIRNSMKNLLQLGSESSDLNRQTSSFIIDSLNSLRAIRTYGMNEIFIEDYDKLNKNFMTVNYKINKLSLFNKLFPLNSFYFFFALYILSYVILNIHTDVIVFTTLFLIVVRLITIVADLLQSGSILLSNLKQTNYLFNFIEKDEIMRGGLSINSIYKIELENLSFSHVFNKYIIQDFNYTFESGKSYAILGPSGTGKSTLLDLIMNFITPSLGSIKFNDLDVMLLDEKKLSNKIIYIGQDTVILNDTIRNNLFIDPKFKDISLNKFLEIVDFNNVLNDLSGGLDHELFYKGTNLSGGQKQRINILRGLLREPDVLIIDEGFSALDSLSRIDIFKKILNEYDNKIVIIVTHDEDILNYVDEKIYLNNNSKYKLDFK